MFTLAWKMRSALVITLAIVVITGTAQKTTRSVQLIQSQRGSFFIAANMTIDLERTGVTLPGLDDCRCRSACFALGDRCQAWASTHLGDGSRQCRIADQGPTDIVPYENKSSTYYFKMSSVPGSYMWQPDNLLYVALNGTFGAQEARDNCKNIPGHRLIIVKSKATFDFFTSLWNPQRPFWITDLHKISQTELVWADGTPSNVTQGTIVANSVFEDIFILFHGLIDDFTEDLSGPLRALCQANPLGVSW